MQVIKLGFDALKRKSAKKQEQAFPCTVAEPVTFLTAEHKIELVIAACAEIKFVLRENS